MGLALSLFLQNQGVIRSKHLDTQHYKHKDELQNKAQQKEEERTFRNEYTADLLYHNGIPNTPLGRYLLQHFRLIKNTRPVLWLEMWYHYLYPAHFYTANLHNTGRRLPPTRKRPH